jgi:5'-nucleotidase
VVNTDEAPSSVFAFFLLEEVFMHILLTNDDGLMAPGLLALKQALAPLAQVTVIAPSRNYSAAGHRKTMHKPLRIDPTPLADGSPAWMCSGAPSDCVALALLGFVKDKVDLVVSGINPHYNIGQDLTYSGTVTAAFEASIFGLPGIAVSTESDPVPNYALAAQVAAELIQKLSERPLARDLLLNVNVPPQVKGWRITRQGARVYKDALVMRHDPRGRAYYWIGGELPTGRLDDGTDFSAIAHNDVSITPLQLDLTAYQRMTDLDAWLTTG